MKKDINPTDLDLMDWMEMEKQAISQVKEAQKMLAVSGEILVKATQMVMHLGGETERERLNKESNINNTAHK